MGDIIGRRMVLLFLEGLEVRDCDFNHNRMCFEEDSHRLSLTRVNLACQVTYRAVSSSLKLKC